VKNKMNENKKRVALQTLGCRLNFSETAFLAQSFEKKGYSVVQFGDEAELTFLNTCTVTDDADSTCRNLIRKAKKISPQGKLIVTGCYAQMDADRLQQMPEIDLLLGTSEKFKVLDYVDELEKSEKLHVKIDQTDEFWGAFTTDSYSQTRAFLKIQDGCNYICSFCVIPFARGRSRTIRVEQAVQNAREIIDQGFKEIVLTGVNIGEYESSSGESLSQLIRSIGELKGLERLRLSSVEANTITKELLRTLKSLPVFCDHFHVPLQSASNEILKKMRRKYTREEYEGKLNLILKYFPHAAIGADVIAGFPGETEEQYQETYDFLKNSPVTHFHVFPYSQRKKTTAANLGNQIEKKVKKARVKKLIALGNENYARYAEKEKDREHEVLFEKQLKDASWLGYTRNYIRFRYTGEAELSGTTLKNSIKKIRPRAFSSEAYIN